MNFRRTLVIGFSSEGQQNGMQKSTCRCYVEAEIRIHAHRSYIAWRKARREQWLKSWQNYTSQRIWMLRRLFTSRFDMPANTKLA